MYRMQLIRIRRKLKLAAQADPDNKVFGARMHRYRMNDPLSRTDLRKFEQLHGITLPEPYAAFLTKLGNGGAGPYYGIYPLDVQQAVSLDWTDLPSSLCLAIGEQGCSYETMLMVTGDSRGKVVYVDSDSRKTFYTYEANFLDWYERWLDEMIAGYDSAWFGLRRGGDDEELMELYRSTSEDNIRLEALEGMLKLTSLAGTTVSLLSQIYHESPGEIRRLALQVLAKLQFDEAEPMIRGQLLSPETADRLQALQLIKWYMPKGDPRFTEELAAMLKMEMEEEAFRFLTMILSESGIDMLPQMVPFFAHSDKNIQIQALYEAGKCDPSRKKEYLPEFLSVLEQAEPEVQLIALQALRGITEAGLFEVFERLLQQHKTDEGYIRSNVKVLLEGFSFQSVEQLERAVPSSLRHVRGILRKQMLVHPRSGQ